MQSSGKHPGLKITGKETRDIEVVDNTFENDEGNSLSHGIEDATPSMDGMSHIRLENNRCSEGCAGGLYSRMPQPAAGR